MPFPVDPDNPNVKRLQATIRDILWQYACSHTLEECQELQRQVDEDREQRRRIRERALERRSKAS